MSGKGLNTLKKIIIINASETDHHKITEVQTWRLMLTGVAFDISQLTTAQWLGT